jgi:hypothetical protein
VNITATPAQDNMLIDCDECGPLGVVTPLEVHPVITGHLAAHGIDTPTEVCDCGYDWANVTGHPHDQARCNDCDWSTYGLFADHQAAHHHLETRHTWALTMGSGKSGTP